MNFLSTKSKVFSRARKIAVAAVFLCFFVTKSAQAQADDSAAGLGSVFSNKLSNCMSNQAAVAGLASATGMEIAVFDKIVNKKVEKVYCIDQRNGLERKLDQAKTWLIDKLWKELQNSMAVAYKAALKNFLNTLAYDMATYVATGDKGQLPMFQTQGWEGYLRNVADNAAGTFIETLGKANGLAKFNLCNPDFRVLLRINLGLVQTFRPSKPACTFRQMTRNWDQALRDKDFLPKLQDMFNPWSNDLGIALTLHSGISSQIDRELSWATKDREEGQGFKPVTDAITKFIRTPAGFVKNAADDAYSATKYPALVYTGSVAADSIDIFVNTLIGKLIEKWLRQGLVTKMPSLANKLDQLTNPSAQNLNEGVAGAENRMKNLVEPSFKTRADYDILAELATCPDPNKAGPTDCVIDEKFRQAIEKKMTVGEALKQGYLNGNGVFGFTADGLEPKFNEGYPYRSLLILRKYRIIPVGWELAAQKIKDEQSAVAGTKNLSDLVQCFTTTGSWCFGLVDPDWVLKAPQNFCKREGAGGEIISQQVTGEGAGSSLAVLRDDGYCADEQSCIKEKADGACQLYGYCTEERRKWDFNTNSCQPLYNTCQTFSNEAGQAVSYLENTLDFRVCNAGNAGCLGYCQNYDYASGEFGCAGGANKIYLNKQAEACEPASEGCHQLIRLNPGGGANLLVNSDFTEDLSLGGWSNFGGWIDGSLQKTIAAKAMPHEINIGDSGYNVAGESYTLSFDAKGCEAGASYWLGDSANSLNLNSNTDWSRYKITYTYPESKTDNQVSFTINSDSCWVDNIKLEAGARATAYSDYADGSSLIHEKLLPDYLAASTDRIQGVCYEFKDNVYQLRSSAPAVCSKFARRCRAGEAGCELYTGVDSGVKIPAQVAAQDYCPAECLGYDIFVQSQTTFDSARVEYFIPRTAKTCSAQAAGCDQFTNLDEMAKGGEGIEYYSYLRQCIKLDTPGKNCAEFYYWQGSDESGFQLKVESLENATDNQPAVTGDDSALCNADIYNKPPIDPAYNADCRQYYNKQGGIFYHLASRTISCTDDCHPYRRSENNELTVGECKSNCPASDDSACLSSCDTADNCSTVKLVDNKNICKLAGGNVILCQSGGVWSSENNACLYNAVPGQGVACSAEQNGCREYVGNTGNDVRQIFSDDFSSGTSGAWQAGADSTVLASNESPTLGSDNKGHSIAVSGGAWRRVGAAVTKGKSYVLNFLAKAESLNDLKLDIGLGNGVATSSFAASANLKKDDWRIFEINLASLAHQGEVNLAEALIIQAQTAGQNFYITNITLKEITDRYYLIKNTWRDNCNYLDADTTKDEVGDLYYAGCSQYTDRASQTHNLKQFNRLCSESAVGCELMIDTKNSSEPGAVFYKDGQLDSAITSCSGLADCVEASADSFIYAVYDAEKLCAAEDQGCQFLGQPYIYENTTVYGDVYLKNNQDKYGQILCGKDAAGCQVFAYDGGEKYFKDPGDQVCQWRQAGAAGLGQGWGWYKKRVKRCGGIGNVCLADGDCADGKKCQLESADIACPTSADKTLGLGGVGRQVSQPSLDASSNNWAGLCPAEESGCREYLEPLSRFNTNIIFNGSFQDLDLDNNPDTADGWQKDSDSYKQDIILNPNTVYRLARNKDAGQLTLDNCGGTVLQVLREITSDNVLQTAGDSIVVSLVDYNNSRLFYYNGDDKISCQITVNSLSNPPNGSVELKPVAIDYQLASGLDKQSCNGLVNIGQGCVLFNERKQAGVGLAALNWDADRTVDGSAPFTGADANDNDANVIIKVAPDRTCDKWLACKSYIKDAQGKNVCFDLGLCDAVDENGDCRNFLISAKANQSLGDSLGVEQIKNLSGYSQAGIQGGSLKTDYYPLGAMEQNGEMAQVSNGGFEYYGDNFYPIGWTWSGRADAVWNANIFSVVNNPVAAQSEGIGNAPEGASFLKLGSSFAAESELIDVMPGADYVITAYLNTINLHSGQAAISILSSAVPAAVIAESVVRQDLGNGWQFQLGKFNSGASAQIKIKLYSTAANDTQGNFYYDDIKIKPALEARCAGNCANPGPTLWYAPQSCRLYPKNDSLSCDYFEDSGVRAKGWFGYCLEYDRRPGDPNACLLWYPIDKVKGDGIEEGAGYADRMPLYYTTDMRRKYNCSTDRLVPVKIGSEYNTDSCCQNADNSCSDDSNGVYLTSGNSYVALQYDVLSPYGFSASCSGDSRCFTTLITYTGSGITAISPPVYSDGTYDYYCPDSGIVPEVIATFGRCGAVKNIPPAARVKIKQFYAHEIVQVVAPMGNNKYWSSRVYKGSDYNYSCNIDMPDYALTLLAPSSPDYAADIASAKNCSYNSDYAPFGSIINPEPVSNPYEWDSDIEKTGVQPLYYELDKNVVRAGREQTVNDVKRLFAKSYGAWRWDTTASRYLIDNTNWGPPGANNEPNNGLCNTSGVAPRPTNFPADYCAILPAISNIKVNGSVDSVTLANSQFVKLSFNSKVDSQQLPLVMYGVDWGDNSKTVVTGVEMRDKPDPEPANPSNDGAPEAIYHLYSYWDMKAKQATNPAASDTIYCGPAGGSALNRAGLNSGLACPNSPNNSACCMAKPKVQIKDNWGWCNHGTAINACGANQWDTFAGWVVVKEK